MNFAGLGENAYLAAGLALLAFALALVVAGAVQETPATASLLLEDEGTGITYSTQADMEALTSQDGGVLYFSPLGAVSKQPAIRCDVQCESE